LGAGTAGASPAPPFPRRRTSSPGRPQRERADARLNIEPYVFDFQPLAQAKWRLLGVEHRLGDRGEHRLGMLGLHVAYDSEKLNSGATAGVLGIGVHVALKAPIGM